MKRKKIGIFVDMLVTTTTVLPIIEVTNFDEIYIPGRPRSGELDNECLAKEKER